MLMRLKETRESLGLSQSEVARKLGVSRQSYNFYENGKRDPDTDTLERIADLLNVSVDYLLGRDVKLTNEAFESITDPKVKELLSLYGKLNKDLQNQLLVAAHAYAVLAKTKD